MTDDLNELIRQLEERESRTGLAGMWVKVEDFYFMCRRRVLGAPRDVPRAIRFAWQRLTRSWDERAVWALDDHVAKTLGAQLLLLAEIGHGWPGPERGWDTYEEWEAALRARGEALLAYHRCNAFEVEVAEWEAVYQQAQEALRWVADHFAMLWD
jgi:hypothetical protein